MSCTIEVSEPIYRMLNQQANRQHSSLENLLEELLAIARFVSPATNGTDEKRGLQRALLELYSTGLNQQELSNLKQLLANFFARRAIDEADKIWDAQNFSDSTVGT